MQGQRNLDVAGRKIINGLIQQHGYEDYRWIDPQQIIISQWVRMKCMFGCREYGHGGACPPNTPTVSECERFFKEYSNALVFRFSKKVKNPEDRFGWTRKVNKKLLALERDIFLAGFERTFLLFMDSCSFCPECEGQRIRCAKPQMSRPSPEALAVDVYTTVRNVGFQIEVCKEYLQEMNRYAFLLVV